MAWADTIEEVKTICWCGKKATCNARVIDGKVAREGEQIVLGGMKAMCPCAGNTGATEIWEH